MQTSEICAITRDQWNSFALDQPSFSLLQSWEWGNIKEKLGWRAHRVSVKEQGRIVAAAQMLIRTLPLGVASFAYIPRGPIGNWLDPDVSSRMFSELHRIAQENRAVFLKIEPPISDSLAVSRLLEQSGFAASSATIQPRSTIILDLTPDRDTLFEQIRKSTRRKIKDAVRKGVTVRVGSEKDFPAFYELMQVTSKRAGFSVRPYHHYLNEWQDLAGHGQGVMLMAFYEDKLLAVDVAYCFGAHAAFFHQASSAEHQSLNPNSLLVWEAVKLLSERGVCTYDLWGIPDEVGRIASGGGELPGHERTDGLWGVYQFKSAFSKNVVYYAGAYDFVYRPSLYRVASSNSLNRNLERIAIEMEWLRGSQNSS